MKSTKIATLGLFKIKILWRKDYEDIIYAHGGIKKILWRDSNYIADVAMWPNMIKTFYIWRKAAEVAFFLNSWSILRTLSTTVSNLSKDVPGTLLLLMMMMMIMNCFCCMVNQQKTFSLISSPDLFQKSSPS